MGKLLCTFTTREDLNELIDGLSYRYTIIYNKIFVLELLSNNELVCTYNVDSFNMNDIPEKTIFLHRKKESNTLYTINALNELIKSLNNNVLDTDFQIPWFQFKNTLLTTNNNGIKKHKTKIYKIINVN